MYEGMTNGKAHKVNHIFDPFISILVKAIETNRPIRRLVKTTAKKSEIVLKNKLKTSQD